MAGGRETDDRRRVKIALFFAVVLVAISAPFDLTKVMDHDVAYFLHAADRTLSGERLYRDIIELNPPTAYWLSTVPAALARLLRTHMVPTFHVWTYALMLASTALSLHVARRVWKDTELAWEWLAPAAVLGLCAMPGACFGQREHLMTALLLPYLVAATAPRAPLSRRVAIAVGVLGGAAVALKPYFALYLVLVELAACARERSWRVLARLAVVTAILVVAAAALATLVFYPEYVRDMVPLGRAIYRGFERPLLEVATRRDALVAYALFVVLAVLASRRAAAFLRPVTSTFAAATLAAIAIYLVQQKAWRYQVLPAASLGAMGVGFALASLAERTARDGAAALRGGALGSVLMVVVGSAYVAEAWLSNRFLASRVEPLVQVATREARGGPILFMSSHVPFTFPVVDYMGAAWPYHHHHFLPLPGAYIDYDPRATGRPFRRPDEMGPVEARFFRTVVDDVLRAQPRVIFVDLAPRVQPLEDIAFDLVAYFRQDPRFDRMIARYHTAPPVSGYEVLVRDD